MAKKDMYERLLMLSADDALTIILNDKLAEKRPAVLDGHKYNPDSSRYILYREKGLQCAKCKITANVAIFERHKNSNLSNLKENQKWHWNFYYKSEGVELMMTRDHILPKSLGGSDKLSNCQPMCESCNRKKGNGQTKETINVPFKVANNFPRDEIENIVMDAFNTTNTKFIETMSNRGKLKMDQFLDSMISNMFNHISQGHNEIPSNTKWKKMSKRLKSAHITNRKLSEKIKELAAELK